MKEKKLNKYGDRRGMNSVETRFNKSGRGTQAREHLKHILFIYLYFYDRNKNHLEMRSCKNKRYMNCV